MRITAAEHGNSELSGFDYEVSVYDNLAAENEPDPIRSCSAYKFPLGSCIEFRGPGVRHLSRDGAWLRARCD